MQQVIVSAIEIEPLEDERLSGRRLGNYRLEKLLGHGNRSSVYQAKDIATWQPVALRVLDADLSADRAFVARFTQAIARVAETRHPHLLPVLDHGVQEGLVYVVRQLVTGETMRSWLGEPLPVAEALRRFLPIAEGLDYAHEQGLVHGDLKPGNVLLATPDEPLIGDFGLAQALPQANSFIATGKGEHLGTPEYIAPEQGCGAPFDKRADLYAFGVMLYEAITGRPPFRAESPDDTPRMVVMAHVAAPPPSPRTFVPDLAPAAEAVLLRALAKRPQDRYPSAVALCVALAKAVGLSPAAPTPVFAAADEPVPEVADAGEYGRRRPTRPRRLWGYALAALPVVLLALAIVAVLAAR